MTKTKPLLLIVAAVVAAGSVAVYLSRAKSSPEATPIAVTDTPQPGGGRIRGNPQAVVTLIEYGDYQCPSCGYYHPIVMELLRRYPEQLKLQFHHFPLVQIHANAMAASLAAEAAGDQGKFWEMHDLLFENQRAWERSPNAIAYFESLAVRLGLNTTQFQQSFSSPATQERVLADVRRGRDDVDGTPTFYINGRKVPSDPAPGLEDLARLIENSLKTAAE